MNIFTQKPTLMKKVMTMALMALFTLSVSAQTPVKRCDKKQCTECPYQKDCKKDCKNGQGKCKDCPAKNKDCKKQDCKKQDCKNKIARNKTAKNNVVLLAKSSVARSK